MRGSKNEWSSILGALVLLAVISAGWAWAGGGAVRLQTSDVSCGDGGTDFYIDCGNGTVTDNRSGLVWLADADCFGELDWNEAMAIVGGLGDVPAHACGAMEPDECDCGLSDGSSPGEWRLPSMAEWKAMMSTGWDSDQCGVAIANDVGNGCWSQACVDAGTCSFFDVQVSGYWSSSAYYGDPVYAWRGELGSGLTDMLARESAGHVWPVRGGQ